MPLTIRLSIPCPFKTHSISWRIHCRANITDMFTKFLKFIGLRNSIQPQQKHEPFVNSTTYWKNRYERGGNSGSGSYNLLARFKADTINHFVRTHNIKSVIEFGCGDGNQLLLSVYPKYIGIDVSPEALDQCRKLFKDDKSKEFIPLANHDNRTADLSISLDVIYHLVEDDIFLTHMMNIFSSANSFVCIYSSNHISSSGDNHPAHVRHRRFTDWIAEHQPSWKLIEMIPNKYPYDGDATTGSFADFYFFQKV